MAQGLVDIHSHILPGIDDGPGTIEQSMAMARAAAESGISTMVATPHVSDAFPDVRLDEIAERCRSLGEAIRQDEIHLSVVPGGEVTLAWAIDASDEQLALASYDQRGKDLLIELPFATPVPGTDRLFYRLQGKGYRLTLAHPERYRSFQHDRAPLHALADQGVLLQLNAESLTGAGTNRQVRGGARQLLQDGLAHVIASDAHRAAEWRPVTRLAEAVEAAAELVGRERAEWMASAAPQAIISGVRLPNPPPVVEPPRRRWFFGVR